MMRVTEVRTRVLTASLALAIAAPAFGADAPVKPEAQPASRETTTAEKAPGISDMIVRQANAERARYGLRALQPNAQLALAAKQLADYMAQTGQFSHYAGGTNPSTRAASHGYRSYSVTENIAMNSGSGSASQVAGRFTQMWMNSSGHRANLLGRGVNQIGVATAKGRNGQVYAVQVFGRGPAQIRPVSN